MSKVILVRHAQASLGKANYDELSQRGFKQAELLGNYFSQYYQKPSTIISGTLKRHEQTAQALVKAYPQALTYQQDADWNEFDFKKLIHLYLKQRPNETPSTGDVRAFFSILKKSMLAWSQDELDGTSDKLENWDEFSARINRAFTRVMKCESEGPQIIVSSGGSIAIKLMQILEISPKTMINLNFQIRNTSFSELLIKKHNIDLVTFNQVNHLLENNNDSMITYA
tara:strand:+ start:3567 stop:4244 length:678 start_codon:yes stop_codon:yes gene_type:complete